MSGQDPVRIRSLQLQYRLSLVCFLSVTSEAGNLFESAPRFSSKSCASRRPKLKLPKMGALILCAGMELVRQLCVV
jgi:hypothetical protein